MKIRRKLRHKNPGALKIIVLTLATVFGISVILLAAFSVNMAIKISNNLPDITNSRIFNLSQKSSIYASDQTTVIAQFQLENRQPVSSLNDISDYVKLGTIATEDARFYHHSGVDFLAILRAAIVIASGGNTQGGSTITMQLMRNTILTEEAQKRSIERKIAEVILATKMEETYSKEEILLMYLNSINYGDGCYGIKAGAEHYYSKSPSDLTLNESATLVGIPQSPTYLAPTNNITAAQNRRNIVLQRMYEEHFIDKNLYTQAKSEPIELNLTYANLNTKGKYPYFTDYIRDQLFERYTSAEIFEGGFQIYTTLDITKQEATELGCSKQNDKLEKDAESVAVSIDPKTGFITSMVGGKDYQENQFNIAADKGRPTGSSFKAFTLVNSIEQGYSPYNCTVNCSSPMTLHGTRIENFNNTSYGTKTIQGATAVSANTGFVRLQQVLGTENVIDTAKKLGIKQANLPEVDTLTLGVADITPLEMASAYATIANEGKYIAPVSITKIEAFNGDVIYDYNAEDENNVGEQVISPEVASAATKVLETVFTYGTATSAQLSNGQPVAGKTGTSEDYRDHTLIGYTPSCVLATWIGKRNYQPTSSYVSCNYLFKTIMDKICENQPIQQFVEASDPSYFYKGNIEYQNGNNGQGSKNPNQAPNVVGKHATEAKQLLQGYGITTYQEFSNDVKTGYVIKQTVQDNRVVLYISKGNQ